MLLVYNIMTYEHNDSQAFRISFLEFDFVIRFATLIYDRSCIVKEVVIFCLSPIAIYACFSNIS